MFDRSYVRGVQNALIQGGHAAFPSEKIACDVADKIAEQLKLEPLKEGGVSKAMTAKIAEAVLDASKWFAANGHKPGDYKKLASLDDLSTLAHQHAMHLMEKAAEGSTIEGGDKGNTEKESPNAEAKMDTSPNYRPPGYAEDSRGKTEVDTKPGAVGKEQEHPKKPSEDGTGTGGSPVEQSRTASLAEWLKKTAEGSTILGADKGNKQKDSVHAESKMDASWRPAGYATFGAAGQGSLGELMKNFGGASAIGKEQPHPKGPANSPSGSNSVTETSAKHSAAEDDPYVALFKKVATEIDPYLPQGIDVDAKVAHVRACMGMTNQEKALYLQGVLGEHAEKTAATPAAVPPGSRTDGYEKHGPDATHARPGAYDGRAANQGTKQAELPDFIKEKMEGKKDGEKGEEKKDEKKEDEKKEGSLVDHLRRIASVVRPSTAA